MTWAINLFLLFVLTLSIAWASESGDVYKHPFLPKFGDYLPTPCPFNETFCTIEQWVNYHNYLDGLEPLIIKDQRPRCKQDRIHEMKEKDDDVIAACEERIVRVQAEIGTTAKGRSYLLEVPFAAVYKKCNEESGECNAILDPGPAKKTECLTTYTPSDHNVVSVRNFRVFKMTFQVPCGCRCYIKPNNAYTSTAAYPRTLVKDRGQL